MKMHPEQFVCALVEIAEKLPPAEIPALADAAIAYLRERRESKLTRMLPRLVREAWGKRGKTLPALIATPTGNIGEACEELLRGLQKISGKEIELSERADPSLLGGAILAYGDERFDASLHGALKDVEAMLTSTLPLAS